MRHVLLSIILLSGIPAVSMAGQNAVLLAPSSQEGQSSTVETLKSEMAGRGESVLEIPANEAGIEQAAALSNGAPVIAADPAAGGFKVYDGTTGADITKKFKSGLSSAKEEVAPEPALEPKSAKKAPTPKPRKQEPPAFKRNHIGFLAGVSNFKKNEDSLDILAAGNAGAQLTQPKAIGHLRFFYEHYFSDKYGLGLAAGTALGNQTVYDIGNRTLNVEANSKTATLYLMRRFGRHFGAYLGGGADVYDFTIGDPSNLAGVPAGPGAFDGSMVVPHGEAGLGLSAGNFSLRLFLKQGLGDGTNAITRFSNGTEYRLIVRDNNTVAAKASGQVTFPL